MNKANVQDVKKTEMSEKQLVMLQMTNLDKKRKEEEAKISSSNLENLISKLSQATSSSAPSQEPVK
jgi:hypothetical protein